VGDYFSLLIFGFPSSLIDETFDNDYVMFPLDIMTTIDYNVIILIKTIETKENKMQKKTTKVRTMRLPVELDARIEELAHKRMCSVNAWIVRTLTREAKPK